MILDKGADLPQAEMTHRIRAVAVGLIAWASVATATEVREVERPILSPTFRACMETVASADVRSSPEAIGILERALTQVSSPYERYQIIFRELGFRFAGAREWQRLFDLLRQGQAEGLFFPLEASGRVWPAYVADIGRLPGFGEFMRENERLRAEAQKHAQVEYSVEEPTGLASGRKYPLVLLLHGGVGSHGALAEDWRSPRLGAECVVVRVQGGECRGSFSRAYEDDGFIGILNAYQQVLDRYPVDASRIVLGGQSNGGRSAIQLVTSGRIAARGLILAFPTKPRALDEQELRDSARRGLRAVFLCGENDWAIGQQRETAALFERAAIAEQFLVFAGRGHEFPEGFPAHIDRALDFILGASARAPAPEGTGR